MPSQARAVWHPAFLEHLRKIIVLDFYIVRSSLIAVEDAFRDGQIQHVKAGFVRGVQDVMIRRYVSKYLQKSGEVPLSIPFSHFTDTELNVLLAVQEQDPKLQVIIHPEKLLKYRGTPIPRDEKAWARASAAIKDTMFRSDPDDLIKRACALANSVQNRDGEDHAFNSLTGLEAIFPLRAQTYAPVGPEYGTEREYYIFVRAERSQEDDTPSRTFKRQVVLGLLMKNENVREIAEIESKPNKFHYSIQMEGSSREVDDIIYEMHKWAHSNNISLGTRTYELWKYLSRNATSGIEFTTMDEIEKEFLSELKGAAGDIRALFLTNEQRKKIAGLWDELRRAVGRVDQCREEMEALYVNLTLFNFNRTADEQDYLKKCGNAWLTLNRHSERMAEDLLVIVLELDGDHTGKEDIANAVEKKIPDKVKKNGDWSTIKNYPLRIAAKYYSEIVGSNSRLANLQKHINQVSEIRNWLAHVGVKGRFEDLVDLKDEMNWLTKLRQVEDATRQLSAILLELDRELKSAEIG